MGRFNVAKRLWLPSDIINQNWHLFFFGVGRRGGRKGDALFIGICVNGIHTLSHAHSGLTEELDEAALAVGLVVLLLEGALVELLETEGADKVLRVELLAHGGDAAARDWLLAARAQRAAPLVVVCLAVRLPVVVEEAAVDERREALPADEALGVPQGVQG